jgi:hypothetical protein
LKCEEDVPFFNEEQVKCHPNLVLALCL